MSHSAASYSTLYDLVLAAIGLCNDLAMHPQHPHALSDITSWRMHAKAVLRELITAENEVPATEPTPYGPAVRGDLVPESPSYQALRTKFMAEIDCIDLHLYDAKQRVLSAFDAAVWGLDTSRLSRAQSCDCGICNYCTGGGPPRPNSEPVDSMPFDTEQPSSQQPRDSVAKLLAALRLALTQFGEDDEPVYKDDLRRLFYSTFTAYLEDQ